MNIMSRKNITKTITMAPVNDMKTMLMQLQKVGYIQKDIDLDFTVDTLKGIISLVDSGGIAKSGYSKYQILHELFSTYLRGIATQKALEDIFKN